MQQQLQYKYNNKYKYKKVQTELQNKYLNANFLKMNEGNLLPNKALE